ncbi:L,D-transpeptidase family protein [Flavobacterium sp.]|uniref:L,D-transpeptidase family protein n=1 Tax=Flavobacterium sp. TaxID=239 RepID=UPI0025BB818C|nr:L,D-transpeptidase family protein [Flavobacterium sp.]
MAVVIFILFVGILAAYYVWPEPKLRENAVIDSIEVWKSRHRMAVYSDGKLLKMYTIALGRNPVGHKQFEGDRKTPEGTYTINERNPNSSYYKNLGISYPNESDKSFASSQSKSAGGMVKIHGLRNGRGAIGKFHRWKDWTMGCIAVTNEEMEELFNSVAPDAKITIHP